MPTYTYKCEKCGKSEDLFLEMGHDVPKCAETFKDCEEESCPKDEELQRVYTAVGIHFRGQGWTEKTSATKEKNEKLKKLYNDSYVGMDNYDKEPYEDRKKREAEEE